MADVKPAKRVSILHLEDSSDDALLLKVHLRGSKLDFDIHWVDSKAAFVEALGKGGYDLILSDYWMPPFDGDKALKYVMEHHPEIPFIMVTGELGEDRAIETLRRGATDYVLKGNLARLGPAVERALRDARAAAERRRAAAELAAVKESLARELADMHRLHDLGARLLRENGLEPALGRVLDACTELLGAHRGNVQLLDEGTNTLRIVSQVGFDPDFLKAFETVAVGRGCVCSEALERRERVVVEDVFSDDRFVPLRPEFQRLGLAACTSTPLFGREGKILGMLSNHFERPHQPSERELRLLDLYIQQAAAVLELRHAS